MKKVNLKKLALLGITGGVMLSAQGQADTLDTQDDGGANPGIMLTQNGCGGPGGCGGRRDMNNNKQQQNMNQNRNMMQQRMMTENELWSQLDAEGRRLYDSMDHEGRDLARKLASQKCAGQNECAGLNSCATDTNSCSGKGGCGGKSPGPFKDKNMAVKVAHQHMQEQRAKMNNNPRSNYRYQNRQP